MREALAADEAAALATRLVVGLAGPEPTPAEWAWLGEHRPAGVILFGRNVTGPTQAAQLCRRLRALVPDLQVMADHEGGPVAQMAAAAGRPPAAWTLGALDDAALTSEVCRETAARLARLGITRVLGPVADVLEHPRNPVIGARAFGADPALCARHVAAAVAGYRAAGLEVCVKHWPGHGGTATDSHLTLEAQLVAGCREPFLAGLAAGADAVMVGHLPVAGGEAGGTGLATLDAAYLEQVRASLAVGGVPPLLVADDVTMGALREPMRRLGVPRPDAQDSGLVEPGDLPAAWLRALLRAGCGLLLLRGIPWRALPLSGALPASEPPALGAGSEGPPALASLAAPAAVWQEARDRLWRREAVAWSAPHLTLAWLDTTAGDRWGAADQRTGAAFAEKLASLFARVERRNGAASAEAPCERLLVTSHRPMGTGLLDGLTLAPGGIALAMGHPSLAVDLRARLGEAWRVGALFDCDVQDLGSPCAGSAA
ncbi:MAG: glycoside hydrolase family 3 protein [bacterium]|nr:glycoside hydrolase family 3 protein [bacterium]